MRRIVYIFIAVIAVVLAVSCENDHPEPYFNDVHVASFIKIVNSNGENMLSASTPQCLSAMEIYEIDDQGKRIKSAYITNLRDEKYLVVTGPLLINKKIDHKGNSQSIIEIRETEYKFETQVVWKAKGENLELNLLLDGKPLVPKSLDEIEYFELEI